MSFPSKPLSQIVSLFAAHPAVNAISHEMLHSPHADLRLTGLRGSAAPVIFGAMQQRAALNVPFLFILSDEEEAGYFYHDLEQMGGADHVLFYPSGYRRAAKYARRDAANEILRTEVLNRLAAYREATPPKATLERPLYIVTSPAALAEKVAPLETMKSRSFTLTEGDTHDLTELSLRLTELGFKRRDYVYEPGEYAIRGSILDIFSYSSEYPYRIDFFGDEVDSLRTFEVQTQLSKERRREVSIVPDTEDASEGGLVDFATYLTDDAILVSHDFQYVVEAIHHVYEEGFARQARLSCDELPEMDAAERRLQLMREAMLTNGGTLARRLLTLRRIRLVNGDVSDSETAPVIRFHTSPQPLFHKKFDLLHASISQLRADGFRIFLLADSAKQAERLSSILDELDGGHGYPHFTAADHTLHEGFVCDDMRIACLTDHQIFDRFHKYSLKTDHARDAKMALSLKELMQFEPGDYIVHIDHGVGRFAGLVRMPGSDGTMQEMIRLTYKNDDSVYVSIHALHKVSKYKGREGEPPRLSSLGTGAWEKLKERTKKKIKDIARDLISLYSRRREARGFAFSHDSFMQHELEASFTYEDTPDQLKVTREVKEDMESARPMDRLVCGDVGFGKTEIAVRAAFKAVCDNKQVAVLVPTTVLALQHYKTFASRLKDFPVRVDYLSRARTAAQTRQILSDLAEGKVNILVGTHKLISKQVKWHDLGLLIIDEEQKFGVAVKERLKAAKVNLDTLTMSATPIPRTLQFSLMGARDFSVIQTPPPNRRPIQTEVHAFSHEVIADAINFEMSRNGQVFIVSSRISQLHNLVSLIHRYVPDARVCMGHGQMPPEELEKIVTGFINYDYDVLVSTTIIENGIDIPNANTIIIDGAHHFGLSDLHQMRGRVGRGARKAFCYLLAPPLSLLPDDARRRLQAIENYSDLGAGIHIAMQDLDIRGAGNLLGAEQSGFIADLGYETYQKILSEAITELKNDEFSDLYAEEIRRQPALEGDAFVSECTIDCDLHAYFPETYIPGASERMLLYRELDGLQGDEQIAQYRSRLLDRFGPLPAEGEELLRIVPLRSLARRVGAERLVLKNRRMTLYFVSNNDSPFYRSNAFARVIDFAATHPYRSKLDEQKGRRRMIISDVPTVEAALCTLRMMLRGAEASVS